MRLLILVKATKDSEAGVMPPEKLIAEMATYHEGWRIKYSKNGGRSFVDGPFAETKELVAGYTIIPNPSIDGGEGEIEVRQYFSVEDFGKSEATERFRKLDIGVKA
jgi:hypothetical protein